MMRLYPKKLRNIEDLEREKQLLLRQSRKLDKEEFLSFESLLAGGKSQDGGGGVAETLLGLLPVSNPIVSKLVGLAVKQLSKRATTSAPAEECPPEKGNKNILRKIAVEFIGGYLKWKAVELSYKGIKRVMNSRGRGKSKV